MEQSDVFISYRRSDVEFVKELVKAIKDSGREVWVDWEDIPPGVEGFSDEIQRGIEGGNAFIAVLSPAYLESEYCLMELREALRLKKRVVPVVLKKFDPAPPPDGIGHINWVYFTPHAGQENKFEDAFLKVIKALEADHEHAREHTRLLTRAIEWDKRQHNNSYLLNGTEIDQAESWQVKAAEKDPLPTELQLDYILNSRKYQRIQQRRFTAAIGVLLVLAVIAGVYAVFKANEARISAEISHSSALASAALQPGNEDIAVALALEATRSEYAPESAYKALARAVYPSGGIRYFIKPEENINYLLTPVVSPDGRMVVINHHLYDMTTGELVIEFQNAPDITMTGLFLPDGKRVILAGDRGFDDQSASPMYLGLYDAVTGKLLQAFDTGIGIGEVQLSADTKTLIVFQPDNKITWWDVNTGKKLREFEGLYEYAGEEQFPLNVFSPDLKWMVTARSVSEQVGEDAFTAKTELSILNTKTMQVEKTIQGLETSAIGQIRFSNDSKRFMVYAPSWYSSTQNTIATVDVQSGEVFSGFSDVTSTLVSFRYSPDGTHLAATSYDQSVTVWDVTTGAVIQKQKAHGSPTIFADFTNSGRSVVSMDNDGVIIHWDIWPGNIQNKYTSPNERFAAIAPDSRFLITEQFDASYSPETLITRDSITMKEVSRLTIPTPETDTNGATETQIQTYSYFLANGLENGIVCYQSTTYASEDGASDQPGKGEARAVISSSLHVASLSSGKIIQSWPLDKNKIISKAQISAKGDEILVYYYGNEDGEHLETWSIPTGDVTHTYNIPASSYLIHAIDPTNTHLLIAVNTMNENGESISTSIQMVDLSSMNTQFTVDEPMPSHILFTPDGTQFLLARQSTLGPLKTDITVHDSKTGSWMHEYTINAPAMSIFNMFPDGKSFITDFMGGGGGGGGELTPSGIGLRSFGLSFNNPVFAQWDLATGELLWEFPDNTSNPIFSPDGKFMFSWLFSDLVTWRFDTHEELVAWTCANRYVPKFTPEQRERFGIESEISVCESTGNK